MFLENFEQVIQDNMKKLEVFVVTRTTVLYIKLVIQIQDSILHQASLNDLGTKGYMLGSLGNILL